MEAGGQGGEGEGAGRGVEAVPVVKGHVVDTLGGRGGGGGEKSERERQIYDLWVAASAWWTIISAHTQGASGRRHVWVSRVFKILTLENETVYNSSKRQKNF